MAARFATVEEYIDSLPEEVRGIVQGVRRSAMTAAPGAAETISYQIPTLTMDGKNVVHFAAWKHHLSLYPQPTGDAALRDELAPYATGKGTLRFAFDEPVPYDLIERVVAQLLAERAP